ncbi:hypothetical protein Q73A0000_12360 [Kaistella flava (ex Peng et al. 2021)]|uniref:Uncharacterized protein n=1 Tax=Kaistella flava (ex Peng et al. 2021) TaxID=2038776 RepID=A0A7M2YCB4_9FLAO|nr:hypothetical protein [Kaistella flava (ex Peng et al. 2021)]QOW11092.1 hypothetical protein Q73A0000_12360 [Kaistella flava (ex Peng et al. 2021)]
MKDFDIEKLERENVFKMPDGFFEDMQNKVLLETVPVKQGKIIKLNWAYGAAAAVALIVGVTVFVNSDSTAETQLFGQNASSANNSATYTLPNDKPQKEATIALQTLEKDLTSVEQTHQKESTEPATIQTKGNVSFADQKKLKVSPNPEVQVDQILASFTSAELADVGRNTEQDIYLDLYN